MSGPKLNSRRGRDERHGAMTAAAEIIVKNAKSAQDVKTARLRELRLARDAETPAERPQNKKKRTSKAIPVDKLTSQNDT